MTNMPEKIAEFIVNLNRTEQDVLGQMLNAHGQHLSGLPAFDPFDESRPKTRERALDAIEKIALTMRNMERSELRKVNEHLGDLRIQVLVSRWEEP